jgi:outer membrane protein TolC
MYLASSAVADEAKPISLMQTVERALAGNADLRRERVAVARADASEIAAEGQFDVLLDSELGTKREVTPPLCTSLSCQDLAASKSTTASFELGLSRNLESGGTLKLSGLASRVASVPLISDPAAEAYPGTFYTSNLALSFTHPLLRGFGAEVTLANLRKARIQQDVVQLNRQMRACNVVRDVVVAYWDLAYATQDLAIKSSAVELAQEQLRITKALIDAGRLAITDSASVERAIAQRREDLAVAEQNLYFRSLDLQRLFGVPGDVNLPMLAAADAPASSAPSVDPAAEIARAIEANPQLRALRLGIRLSQADIATARSTLRPKLDFTGSVGPVGRKPGLRDSLGQMAGFDNLTWSAGLAFEMPVENRVARGQMRAAEEELNLTRIDAEDFAVQVRDLVLRTARSIHTAARRVELGQQEVAFAELNLDAEKARFEVGRATNNDVLLRQQELKDAETRLLRATVDQNESEVALSAVTAEVLDRYGVVLK